MLLCIRINLHNMSDFDMSDDDLDFDDLDVELETTTNEVNLANTDKPENTDNPENDNNDKSLVSKNALNDLSEEDFDNIDIDEMLLDDVELSVEEKKKPITLEKSTKQKIKQKLPKEVKKLLASIKTADLIDDREDINNAQLQRKQVADRLANDPRFDKMYKKAEKRYFKSMQDSDESVSSSASDSIDSSGSEYLEAKKLVWQHHNKSKYTADSDFEDSSADSYDSSGYVGKNGRKKDRGRERRSQNKDTLKSPDLSMFGTVTDIIPDDVSDDDSYEELLKYEAPQKVGIYAPGAVFNINITW